MGKEFFTEKQRFNQKWLIAIILVPLAITIWGIIQQIILKKPFGNNPAPDVVLLLTSLIPLILLAFFLMLNLRTTIDRFGIRYQFWPVHRREREIKWENISKAYVRKYKPILEYGGWGFRTGRSGRALNTSGNMGLQLELKNGKKLLIGTHKPEELERILRKLEIKGSEVC